MDYAKSCLQEQVDKLPEYRRFWELYHLAMLCFLKGDFEEGKDIFEHYMQRLKTVFILGIVILNGMNNFITIVLKTFNVTYLQRNLHNRWL